MKTKQNSGTILIVDDVLENLRLLSKMLSAQGYKTRAVKTGLEAIASANAELPDLILLDIRLPDISGYEVCTTLKANEITSVVPVVFLSALNETEEKLRGFAAGGVDYITKPFASEEVLVRVQTYLEMGRLRLQLKEQNRELQLKNEQLQVEGTECKRAAEKLAESFAKVEDSKTATLNLLEDLKTEIELRKRTEELLRETSDYLNSLIDYANAPIITWDVQHKITRFNHAFEGLTGYSVSEMVGKELPILFSKDSRDESLRKIAQTSSGELWKAVEIPIQRKDGEIRVALWNSANIFDKEGKEIVATIAQGQDITERKRVEKEFIGLNTELERKVSERTGELRDSQLALLNLVDDLNQSSRGLASANDALDAVNKELAAFSYSVSHDLRAPLRSIDGFSNALLEDCEDKLDDDGKKYLERIRRATQNMGRLIDDMLNLSRVTQSEFRQEQVDLSKMVHEIIDTNQQRNPLNGMTVNIQEDIIVQGDQRLMHIAMTNLLDNAWKFAGKQEHSQVEFGAIVKDGERIIFVRDNGVGFDMNYAGKLFGAFQRLHRSDEFPGTGIGLATVRRVMNRHGGQAWAESEVGKGATFFFTLPE
jgi:PAS domain S-box-containing protein